jgi:hypothetical protein
MFTNRATSANRPYPRAALNDVSSASPGKPSREYDDRAQLLDFTLSGEGEETVGQIDLANGECVVVERYRTDDVPLVAPSGPPSALDGVRGAALITGSVVQVSDPEFDVAMLDGLILLQRTPDIESAQKFPLLHACVLAKRMDLVNHLLALGADANISFLRDGRHMHPMDAALDDPDMVANLLRHGADPRSYPRVPLSGGIGNLLPEVAYLAAVCNEAPNLESIAHLLKHGGANYWERADINEALAVSILSGEGEVAEMLLRSYGPCPKPDLDMTLKLAVSAGQCQPARYVLKRGANPFHAGHAQTMIGDAVANRDDAMSAVLPELQARMPAPGQRRRGCGCVIV